MKQKLFKRICNVLSLMTIGLMLLSCNNNDIDGVVLPYIGGTNLEGFIYGPQEITLDESKAYTISGNLIIGDEAVLIIPKGMKIKAAKGADKYILVLKGGQIRILGTKDEPVTIAPEENSEEPGYWGGIIINGKAPIAGLNASGLNERITEINHTYMFGGNKENDSSGRISYLILKYPGAKFSETEEHNGLTLNAVGRGTTIDHLFVLGSADDAVECFGGTVDVTNLLAVDADDDMFDFTEGYKGTFSDCYGCWQASFNPNEADPSGLEVDGNLDGLSPEAIDQTTFVMKNLTLDIRCTKEIANLINLRRGATVTLSNTFVKLSEQAKLTKLVNLTDEQGDVKSLTSDISYTLFDPAQLVDKSSLQGAEEVTIQNSKGIGEDAFSWTGFAF